MHRVLRPAADYLKSAYPEFFNIFRFVKGLSIHFGNAVNNPMNFHLHLFLQGPQARLSEGGFATPNQISGFQKSCQLRPEAPQSFPRRYRPCVVTGLKGTIKSNGCGNGVPDVGLFVVGFVSQLGMEAGKLHDGWLFAVINAHATDRKQPLQPR